VGSDGQTQQMDGKGERAFVQGRVNLMFLVACLCTITGP
jgi:hypothetical protein